jgi:hypothetical protein
MKMNTRHVIGKVFLVFSFALGTTSAVADDAPNGAVASPKVYKIIAENAQWRVLEGTWQPGEEDNFHSHPGDRVSLFPMDCKLRLTNPDGTYKDVSPKAGKAKVRTGEPVKAHKAKNIGDKACTLYIVEQK